MIQSLVIRMACVFDFTLPKAHRLVEAPGSRPAGVVFFSDRKFSMGPTSTDPCDTMERSRQADSREGGSEGLAARAAGREAGRVIFDTFNQYKLQ